MVTLFFPDRRRLMRRLVLVSSFSLGVLALGCGSDPGSMLVGWNVGLSGNCAEADIATVRITLEEEGGGTLGPFDASCAAGEGGATFKISDVDEGSYTIVLEGLDADGATIYTGRSSSRTNVTEGKTATPAAITLSPAPASLTVGWKFLDGRGCAVQDGPPTTVRVLLFKSDAQEADETAPCEDYEIVLGDLEADDNYDVQVTALGGTTPLYRYEEVDIDLADGEQLEILGDLLACDPGECN
jgi:hypothetical protein